MWQHLLRQWLTQQAQEQLWKAAAEKGSASQPAEPAPQRPCDVLIVSALASELAGLEDKLSGVLRVESGAGPTLQAGLAGCHLVGTVVGALPGGARELAALSLAAHRPAWLVSAGFAASASPDVQPGEIVVADRVADREGHTRPIPPEARTAIATAASRARQTTVLSLPGTSPSAEERRRWETSLGAHVVDGLGWELSQLAEETSVPWLVVRVVLEAHDEVRPSELDRLAQAESTARWLGGLAGLATSGAGRLGAWWRWQERVLAASDRLGAFLAEVVPALRR